MFVSPCGGSGLLNTLNRCATNAVVQFLRNDPVLWKALTGPVGKVRARHRPPLKNKRGMTVFKSTQSLDILYFRCPRGVKLL